MALYGITENYSVRTYALNYLTMYLQHWSIDLPLCDRDSCKTCTKLTQPFLKWKSSVIYQL